MTTLEVPPDLERPYEYVPLTEKEEVVQCQLELRNTLNSLVDTSPDDAQTFACFAAKVVAATPGLTLPSDFRIEDMPPLRPELFPYYHQLLESGVQQRLQSPHECCWDGNHTWIPLAPIFPLKVQHYDSICSHNECKPSAKQPYWAYDILISEAWPREGVEDHRTKANLIEGASIFAQHPQTGSVRVTSPRESNKDGNQIFFTNSMWDAGRCQNIVHPGMVIADSYHFGEMFKAPPNGANTYSNFRHHHEVWIGGRSGLEAPSVDMDKQPY